MVYAGLTPKSLRNAAGVNKKGTGTPEFFRTGEKAMQLERYLIEYCAPTLASLKAASLFCLKDPMDGELDRQIAAWNARLQNKGLVLQVLRRRSGGALIYVYRTSHLKEDLQRPGVSKFLTGYGYRSLDVPVALAHLIQRLEIDGAFPHEIGLFLGYPLEDVVGFIQNKGKNCKCTGCWKVYSDERRAMELFTQFDACRKAYGQLWAQGKSVWQLTVAAQQENPGISAIRFLS
jgi:hypothetical protein